MEKFQSYKRQNTDFERSKNLEQEKNKLLFMISAQEYYRNQLEIYFNEHSFLIGESEVKKKHEQIKREALGQVSLKIFFKNLFKTVKNLCFSVSN